MASLFLRNTIESSAFNFIYDGYDFSYGSQSFSFHYMGMDGYIAPLRIEAEVNSGTINYPVTVEFSINQSGSTATSGQVPLTLSRSTLGNITYYRYIDNNNSRNYKLYMPWNDGRLATIHIIVRVNGSICKDVTFQTAAPINLGLSSISPTPQTGKVCTVTLANTVVNNTYWKMTEPFKLYAYHNTSSSAEYPWYYVSTYINNGTTLVEANASGFNQFQFYYVYSTRARTDDSGQLRAKYCANCRFVDL